MVVSLPAATIARPVCCPAHTCTCLYIHLGTSNFCPVFREMFFFVSIILGGKFGYCPTKYKYSTVCTFICTITSLYTHRRFQWADLRDLIWRGVSRRAGSSLFREQSLPSPSLLPPQHLTRQETGGWKESAQTYRTYTQVGCLTCIDDNDFTLMWVCGWSPNALMWLSVLLQSYTHHPLASFILLRMTMYNHVQQLVKWCG